MDDSSISHSNRWRNRLQRLRGGLRSTGLFLLGVVAALLAILLYNHLFPAPHQLTASEVNDTVAQVLASATPPPAFSARVFQIIQPSLVLVEAKLPDKDGQPQDALGTGVIIDTGGDILTALHVVTNASSVQLVFADGTRSSAQVVKQQPEIDIAVLQADRPPAKLIPATLGNPNALQVGDEAYVVGNPFGLYASMSAGVISGFGRTFQTPDSQQELKGLIQIDTAVNPGNSGGPLLNRDGQVVGIVEGLANPTGQDFFIGIGFAVPINVAGGAVGSPPD